MATPTQYLRFLITLSVSVLTSQHGSAQHRAALKVQTFRAIEGLYTIGFEHALDHHFSGQISFELGSYIKMRPNRFEDYKAKGFGVIGAFRYYPFTKKLAAPEGFFVYTAFRTIRFHDTYIGQNTIGESRGGGNVLNIGGGVGYKFVYRRIGIEGFVGWGTGRITSDNRASTMPEFFRTSMNEQKHFPQLDIALCYMLTKKFED